MLRRQNACRAQMMQWNEWKEYVTVHLLIPTLESGMFQKE